MAHAKWKKHFTISYFGSGMIRRRNRRQQRPKQSPFWRYRPRLLRLPRLGFQAARVADNGGDGGDDDGGDGDNTEKRRRRSWMMSPNQSRRRPMMMSTNWTKKEAIHQKNSVNNCLLSRYDGLSVEEPECPSLSYRPSPCSARLPTATWLTRDCRVLRPVQVEETCTEPES